MTGAVDLSLAANSGSDATISTQMPTVVAEGSVAASDLPRCCRLRSVNRRRRGLGVRPSRGEAIR